MHAKRIDNYTVKFNNKNAVYYLLIKNNIEFSIQISMINLTKFSQILIQISILEIRSQEWQGATSCLTTTACCKMCKMINLFKE